MSINKLTVFAAAFILASILGSTPAAAQVTPECDPTNLNYLTLDCDGDGELNGVDLCPFHDNEFVADLNDCDGDEIVNLSDTCDNLDPTFDCDGDGLYVDACPYTDMLTEATFGFGNTTCNISGLDTILESGIFIGCSLAEVLEESLDACDDNPRNHGKFVSCVAKATNKLKKQKIISGAQKGQIQSCAAHTDIGKKPKP